MLKLEFPSEKHREMYDKMKQKWLHYEIARVSDSLFKGDTYDDFLKFRRDDLVGIKGRVPATFFFLTKNEKEILGHIQIRHHIEHPNLKEVGGHIGYGIVPWEWGKGYGKKQLELGLLEAKKLGIDRVMVSCVEDNIGSEKVILSQGGQLEKIVLLESPPEDMMKNKGKSLKLYWIDIK